MPGKYAKTIKWDEARDARLRSWYAEGKTCSQIAALFGDCSRNSVIGRIHRIGLASRNPGIPRGFKFKRRLGVMRPTKTQNRTMPPPKFAATSPVSKPVPQTTDLDRLRIVGEMMRAADTVFKPVIEMADYVGVSLLDLTPNCCRWPLNDPPRGGEFLFCGAPKRTGSSYCDEHHAMSRQSAPRPVYVSKFHEAA